MVYKYYRSRLRPSTGPGFWPQAGASTSLISIMHNNNLNPRVLRPGNLVLVPFQPQSAKKRHLWNGASECRNEYIRSIISIHGCYGNWYNPLKSPSRTRKWVKETYCWMAFHIIWTVSFLCHHVTNPFSLHK